MGYDRPAALKDLLARTDGRDQLMGVLQFLPGVLIPVAERAGKTELVASLQALATMAGGYRSVTRLSAMVGVLTRPSPPIGDTPEAIFKFLAYLKMSLFFPMENIAVCAGNGIICRDVPAARKAEYGGRAVYFWFWSLFFEQLHHAASLMKLNTKQASEKDKEKSAGIISAWTKSFLWFILAWGSMPINGQTVKLLQNPETSFLRPLHALVEATTVPGLQISPFAKAAVGLAATLLTLKDM
eukprot:TRINITY_DN7480_c0_g1_i6.p1 TRINITY_DN7480_c0_g1~~TRINITY_DN7480_c0_g1_i6.p1  ORF type:complete len:261 (+),score=40.54 TRINITY_DN7480_c0_g1_i6:63-785(+)